MPRYVPQLIITVSGVCLIAVGVGILVYQILNPTVQPPSGNAGFNSEWLSFTTNHPWFALIAVGAILEIVGYVRNISIGPRPEN